MLEALSKFNSSNENTNNVIQDSGVNNEPFEDGSPEVYVRQNKEKELDILWKDFKIPRGENSPIVFLGVGFIAGIIATLAVSAIIGMSSGNVDTEYTSPKNEEVATSVTLPNETTNETYTDTEATAAVETEENTEEVKPKKFGFFSSNKNKAEATAEPVAQANKEYEVQSGDTMERIVKNFYGTYSEEGVNNIMKANNMTNPNKLSIGQKLIIPSVPTASAQ